MKISDFDYNLPNEKIAKFPPIKRGDARLLVFSRKNSQIQHKKYVDLIDSLNPGDLLILNETKVVKARLKCKKLTGKLVEIFILERHDPEIYGDIRMKALAFGQFRPGERILLEVKNQDPIEITIEEVIGNGIVIVSADTNLLKLAEDYGEMPIPPYMKRVSQLQDETRYQTEFAKVEGSVAAPTASLNFTNELKNRIIKKGVNVKYLTLHVGLGTFLAVKAENVEDHEIHTEMYEISRYLIKKIRETKEKGNKVVAIGTTVTRALEHASDKILDANFKEDIIDEADIYIYPPYEFKIVDILLTNFHAPRSTVILLTAAFAGKENLEKAYQEALDNDYMFLSYGDSMLIL